MELFYICIVQRRSHKLHMATERFIATIIVNNMASVTEKLKF